MYGDCFAEVLRLAVNLPDLIHCDNVGLDIPRNSQASSNVRLYLSILSSYLFINLTDVITKPAFSRESVRGECGDFFLRDGREFL